MAERKTTERKYYVRKTKGTCYLWIVSPRRAILIQYEDTEAGKEIISLSKFRGALPFRPDGYLHPSPAIVNDILHACRAEINEYRPLAETLN